MPMPTIRQHKRGNYYVNVSLGGKRITIYGRTPEEVERKYVAKLYEFGQGNKVNETILMKDYLRQWVANKRPELSPYTFQTYKGNIENHIIPALGGIQVRKLTPADVVMLYNQKRAYRKKVLDERVRYKLLKEKSQTMTLAKNRKMLRDRIDDIDLKLVKSKPLGETSLLYLDRILRAALHDAVRNRIMATNPMDSVRAPKRDKVHKTPPEAEDVLRLFQAVRGKEYELGVHLAVACGMRRGEICGVEWGDMNWKKNVLTVRRQIRQTAAEGLERAETKDDDVHIVKVSPGLVRLMKAIRERQACNAKILGDAYDHNDYMVTHNDGTIYTPYALSMSINYEIRKLGLKTTLHGLRGTYVSLGYLVGGDEKAIADSVGHDSVEFNRARYQTVYDAMKEDLANKMNAILYPDEHKHMDEEK